MNNHKYIDPKFKENFQIKSWIEEASGNTKIKISDDLNELSMQIESLRHRLIVISDVFGYNNPTSIMYSQYLDVFIVKYQRLLKSLHKDHL